ncbi:hypothetical protein X798_04488 [Onchocerca flexuosa]|uniref:Uncharacterized protein n=1 Tax=Onchocerca flexuosa TaxID=387005 RepID=A0A238BU91_9BILA|nr:hypothetical protein X798_04488 [Onchocerca flexuosa]
MSLLHASLESNEWRSNRVLRSHRLLKCLAQCHVVLGLIIFILAALADYMSSRIHTIRMKSTSTAMKRDRGGPMTTLLHEERIKLFNFEYCSIIGICGSASHRRGLILAFMLMNLHAILIFVPAIIIVSSFDIHFYQAECFGECDWHLLTPSLPENSRCQILCGENIDDNKRSLMTRLGTEYRLDAGIIAATILQMVLSLFSASLCCREVCMECRPIMWNDANQQLDMTTPLKFQDSASN